MPSSSAEEEGRARAACLLAVALALGLGLCGVDWGLPGPDRFAALPQRIRGDAPFARHAEESWKKLYEGIAQAHKDLAKEEPVTYVQGVEVLPAGWTWPPDPLINSIRSFLLRTEHPDEQKSFVVLAQMRPWKRDFKPLYLEYGGSFIYPLGAWLWTASKVGAVTLVSDVKHYMVKPGEMGALFLWSRLYVLLFHLGTVVLVFRLGRRMSGVEGGFIAAVLFAILPVVAVQTHVVKPHPVAAFWLAAAVEAGAAGSYLLCGAAAGIAAGANFSLLGALALPGLMWLVRGASKAELKRLAGGVACGVAAFAAANPYAVASPRDYLWETTVYPSGHAGPSLAGFLTLLGPRLAGALGAGVQLVSGLALVSALVRRDEPSRTLVAASLGLGFLYLWVGLALFWGFSTGPGAARFFYACFPLAAALAGAWLASPGAPGWLRAALLLVCLFDAGRRSAVYLENLRVDAVGFSTRDRAVSWLEANLKPGEALGLTRYPQPATTPPFRFDRYKLVVFSDPALLSKKTMPKAAVVDGSGKDVLERAGWTVAESFRPAWENVAAADDDSFFANSPMYAMRPPK